MLEKADVIDRIYGVCRACEKLFPEKNISFRR